MKTFLYIQTALALLISMMVNGQTYLNQINNIRTSAVKDPDSVKAAAEDYSKLVKAADYYDKNSRRIKDASAGRQSVETELMLIESKDFSENSIVRQLQASELAEKMNIKAFTQNNKTIYILMGGRIKDIDSKDQATNLVSDANSAMRSAKNLRMEGKQMQNLSARLGYLGNAEEKEFVALMKQEKAIFLLEKALAISGAQIESAIVSK